MLTNEERGPVGAWLKDEGIKRGGDTAAKRLAALNAAGIRINRADYAQFESGRLSVPAAKLQEIKDHYRSAPPSAGSGDPLIEAIAALVEEMRLSRAQQTVATDALLAAMASVVGGRAPLGTSADSEPAAPARTPR